MNNKWLDDELFDIYCQDGKTIIESLREIYEKGRADREKELSELPNEYSEQLWKLAYNRGRTDAIDEFVTRFEFENITDENSERLHLIIYQMHRLEEKMKAEIDEVR